MNYPCTKNKFPKLNKNELSKINKPLNLYNLSPSSTISVNKSDVVDLSLSSIPKAPASIAIFLMIYGEALLQLFFSSVTVVVDL